MSDHHVLKEFTAKALNWPISEIKVQALQAHASYRSYFRLSCESDRKIKSVIVMQIPEGAWSVSEEITTGEAPAELPFIALNRYLSGKGFPVPQIIKSSEKEGIILLEDLGSMAFEDLIKGKSLSDKMLYYQKAIRLMVDLQNKCLPSDNSLASQRSFTEELLIWELNHFLEYGIEKRLDIKINETDTAYFKSVFERITAELLAAPQVFVHRDFQSQNLLWHNEQLYLIDYQDALMGPLPYDLVALLRDSYVSLDRRLRQSLVDYFLEYQSEKYQREFERAAFRRLYEAQILQRKLKDAGRFVFIEQVKGNSRYMQYLPNTLQYIREALQGVSDYHEFYERLRPYVPEWKKDFQEPQ